MGARDYRPRHDDCLSEGEWIEVVARWNLIHDGRAASASRPVRTRARNLTIERTTRRVININRQAGHSGHKSRKLPAPHKSLPEARGSPGLGQVQIPNESKRKAMGAIKV